EGLPARQLVEKSGPVGGYQGGRRQDEAKAEQRETEGENKAGVRQQPREEPVRVAQGNAQPQTLEQAGVAGAHALPSGLLVLQLAAQGGVDLGQPARQQLGGKAFQFLQGDPLRPVSLFVSLANVLQRALAVHEVHGKALAGVQAKEAQTYRVLENGNGAIAVLLHDEDQVFPEADADLFAAAQIGGPREQADLLTV